MKLELALAQYTDALTNLKLAKSEPSEIEILHILVARDAIEEALSEKTQLSVESLAKLLELDNFLKQQAHAIARGAKLAQWRATFHHFTPPQRLGGGFSNPPRTRKFPTHIPSIRCSTG